VKGNIKAFFIRYMRISFGKRKIGRKSNGFWITLPRMWCVSNDVKPGDSVEIEMNDEGLLIITVGEDGQN